MVAKAIVCSKANRNFIIIGIILACLAGAFHLAGKNFIKNRIHEVKLFFDLKNLKVKLFSL